MKFENPCFNQFSKNCHAKGWWRSWKKLSKSEELWLIRQALVDVDISSFLDKDDVDNLGTVQLNPRK